MSHTAETLAEAFHYLYPAEVAALKTLARYLPPDPVVVNIGAGSGTSGLAFLEARHDLTLITIDITADDSPFGCLTAEKNIVEDAGLAGRAWYQIHSPSIAAGQKWPNFKPWNNPVVPYNRGKLVDLVFVDGDHTFDGASGDIKVWWKLLKPFGIMAIHDYEKVTHYYAKHPYADKSDDHITRFVKPYPGVDKAVATLLTGKFPVKTHVETLIAFENRRT